MARSMRERKKIVRKASSKNKYYLLQRQKRLGEKIQKSPNLKVLEHRLLYSRNKGERKKLKRQIETIRENRKEYSNINKKLYGSEQPFSEKRLSKTLKIERKLEEENKQYHVFRYSIDYYNAEYEKNFRAEIYVLSKRNDAAMKQALDTALRNKVASLRHRGIKKLFGGAYLVGFESDEVGRNDIGASELNRVIITLENIRI